MKKILFLLLSTVSIYGQVSTGQEQEFDYGIKNNSAQTVTTANHLTTTGADGTQGKILPSSLPISTAVANALDLKVENSAGAIQGFAITDNGNGTVNIATGTAYLRTTNDPYSPLIKYVIPSVTNLALTDNANNFVLVDYNSGTPALTVSVSPGTVNTMTNSIAYVISRVGTTLDYVSLIGQNIDANGKLRRRFLNSEGLKRASGAVLSGLNRNLVLTGGLYYSGLIEVPTPAFNTSTSGTFTQAYLNGGSWVRTTGNTQINNTQYNLSGVLTTMPSNDYRVDYVYILADNPSKLYVLLGNTTYNNIGSARLAPVPSDLPSELQFLGTRVGRIIIKKDDATMEVSSEFATIYQAGSAQLHNDLAGLNAGDFQHLTVAEKTNLELKSNKQNNLVFDGTSVKYPTVDAVNIALDQKKNVDVVDALQAVTDAGNFTTNSIDSGSSLSVSAVNYNTTYVSPNTPLDVIQGYAFDGNHHYLFGNNTIRKYNLDYSLLLSNTNALAGISGVDHLGDGFVLNGFIYVPVETYPAVTGMKIAKYNANTLALVTTYDISAQGHECSSMTTDGATIYISSYDDGTKLWKYDLVGNYLGPIVITTPFTNNIQGVSLYNNEFYIVEQTNIWKLSFDGITKTYIKAAPGNVLDTHRGEGLQVVNGEIRVVIMSATTGNVYYLNPEASVNKAFMVGVDGIIKGYGATLVGGASNDLLVSSQNTNSAGLSGFTARDNIGNKYLTFGINNSTSALGASYGAVGEGVVRSSSATASLSLSVTSGNLKVLTTGAGTERMRIVGSNGNVLINTATDSGFKLDNNGTTRLQSTVTLGTLPTTSAGTYDFLTRNTSTGVVEKVLSSSIIGGTGTANFLPKFTNTKVIGNSIIFDNGTNVGIGNSSPTAKLDVTGSAKFESSLKTNSLTFNSDSNLTIGSNIRQLAINSNNDSGKEAISLQARTNANTASSLVLQPLGGAVIINNLSGTGTRTVVADATGELSTVPSSGVTPDLQTVLDNGNSFSYDSDFSNGAIASGTPFNRQTYFQHQNNETGALIEQSNILIRNDNTYIQNVFHDKNSAFYIYQGDISIDYGNATTGGDTKVQFNDPTVVTVLKFPANSTAGTYTIDTTAETIFTVATLPTGTLNQRAIVSDALTPTFLGALVGGGSVVCPVWHNGTTWVSR